VNVNTYYKHVCRYHSKEYYEKQPFEHASLARTVISVTDSIEELHAYVETSPSSSSAVTDHEDMAPEYSDPSIPSIAVTDNGDMAPEYNDPSDFSIGDSVENNNLNSDESQDSADEQKIKLFMKVKMDHKLTQKAFDEVIKVN